MMTKKMQKFDFGSEEAAEKFAVLKRLHSSYVKVKGTVVTWVEETTD